MERFLTFFLCAVLVVVGAASAANGDLMWSSSLDDDAATTNGGGYIVNGPTTYASGVAGNAFIGNGSVYAQWDDTEVANIFDTGWDNSAGWTVDLYFGGDHWDTHSGDSGLWSVTDRLGGPDGYIMATVRDGSLRMVLKDSYTGTDYTQYLTDVTLENNTIYHLVAQNIADQLTISLNDTVVFDQNIGAVVSFPATGIGNAGTRWMAVGTRAYFGGTLQAGEWVDEIKIYNGIPEPATMLLLGLGGLSLVRRKKA